MRRAGWDNRRRMARELEEQERMPAEAPPRSVADRFDGPPARTVRRAASAERPVQSSARAAAGQDVRPVEGAEPGRGAGHRHVQLSQGRRRGALPRLAGRGRQAHLPHRRHAAHGRERQVHDRRFLREQDARIRQHVRLHAHQGIAAAPRHDRSLDRRGLRERHRDQAPPGGRRQRGPRQAEGPPSPRGSTGSKPGATSKARCWPPCRWRPRSSTSCCS